MTSNDIIVEPMEVDCNVDSTISSAYATTHIRSEPIPYHHNCLEDELLEDWPHNSHLFPTCHSSCDEQILRKKLQKNKQDKHVAFSEKSYMHIYPRDPVYARNKSYTKNDRKVFISEALRESLRMKRLLAATPGSTTRESLLTLLTKDIISPEELVGIDHLVLKSAPQSLKDRKDHIHAVLRKQWRQEPQDQLGVKKFHQDSAEKLRQFSVSMSSKSVKRARIRAAMAA